MTKEEWAWLLSFIAMALLFASYFFKKKSVFLALQSSALCFLIATYLLRGSYFATVGLSLGLARTLAYLYYENKGRVAPLACTLLFSIATIAAYFIVDLGVLKDAKPVDILYLGSLLGYAVAFRITNVTVMRRASMIPILLSVLYNSVNFTTPFVLASSLIEFASNAAAIVKYEVIDGYKKEKTKERKRRTSMKEIKIAPSILSADFAAMGEAAQNLEKWGADVVHCDVMDGVFVDNITFGLKMVEDIRKRTSLPLDCHLMIVHPEKFVERFANAGADIITVHYEACKDNLKETLALIRSTGKKCGAVINPDTPVSAIEEAIPLCDMVLVMSVFPGFGGQAFIPSVLEKVREIRAIADKSGKDVDIEIDGGINPQTAAEAKKAGANVLVAGSAVFKAADPKAAIEALRKA